MFPDLSQKEFYFLSNVKSNNNLKNSLNDRANGWFVSGAETVKSDNTMSPASSFCLGMKKILFTRMFAQF